MNETGRVRGKDATGRLDTQTPSAQASEGIRAEGHPPPARPPPARCEAVGTSVGVWSPAQGSPCSRGGGWRRCGSSGRSGPCGEPACYRGPCTSARASGCWTARSGTLRGTGARLSVPGTAAGRGRAGNVHGQSPRTVFKRKSGRREAHHCRRLIPTRSGASHETAHVGSPVGRGWSAWRGPVTRWSRLCGTQRLPGDGEGHEANGFSQWEGNAGMVAGSPSRGDRVTEKDSGSL